MLRGVATRASSSKGGGGGGGPFISPTTNHHNNNHHHKPFLVGFVFSFQRTMMMMLGGVQQHYSNHHHHFHRRQSEGKVVTMGLETTTKLFSSNTNTTNTRDENEREEEEDTAAPNNVVDAFLVTGYGRDRPGIYAQFSRAASAIRADIEAARLAKLGSDFTITALVSVAKKHNNNNNNNNNNKTKKALQDALDAHIDRFTCDVREVPPETRRNEAHARSRGYKKLIIRATNFPGITSRVTETLAKCGLNIEALRMDTKMSPFNNNNTTTTTSSTRNGDDEMYFCEATVRLIDGAFREDTFKKEVEKLEDELSCDVDVEDVSDVE